MPPRRPRGSGDVPDDPQTRRAKSESLRRRIEQIDEAEGESDAGVEESPRSFIERRMKETRKKASEPDPPETPEGTD